MAVLSRGQQISKYTWSLYEGTLKDTSDAKKL